MKQYCELCEKHCPKDDLGCGEGRRAYAAEALLDEWDAEEVRMDRTTERDEGGPELHRPPREFDGPEDHRPPREIDGPELHRPPREFDGPEGPERYHPPFPPHEDPGPHGPHHPPFPPHEGPGPHGPHHPPFPPHEGPGPHGPHHPPFPPHEGPGPHHPPFPPHSGPGPHGPRPRPPRFDPEELLRQAEGAGALELFDLCHRVLHRPDAGAARGQGRALAILAQRGEMSQRELQDMLRIAPGSMSELIAKLERKELLTRARGDDRRSNLLRITDAGREAAAQLESPGDELLSALSENQREQFTATLKLLLSDWLHRDEYTPPEQPK